MNLKAYWFNPENDMALAADCVAFTPGVGATQVHMAGSLLPLWLAEGERDIVLVPDCALPLAESLVSRFGLKAHAVEAALNPDHADFTPAPWGWSRAARTALRHMGFSASSMPSDSELAELRRLSGRQLAVDINSDFPENITSRPVVCRTLSEFREVMACDGDTPKVVKYPWSSSGRGVFYSSHYSPERLEQIASGSLRRQGYVVVERRLDKVSDFAALFHFDGNGLDFRGYSCFFNNNGSNYGGNLVAPQDRLIDEISRHIDNALLNEITYATARSLENRLQSLMGVYNGWIGVDMMVHETPDGRRIAPCIEVNLRATMGVVALKMAECQELMGSGGGAMLLVSGLSKEAGSDDAVIRLSPEGFASEFRLEPI